MFFVIKYFGFFPLEVHESLRQDGVFCYTANYISMFTIVRPNCSPMRTIFAVCFLKCLERDPNELVDHKSTD